MLSTFCDYINIISPSLERNLGKEQLYSWFVFPCREDQKGSFVFQPGQAVFFYVKEHLKCVPTQGKPRRTTQVWVSIEASCVLMLLMLIQHHLKRSISQDIQTLQTWVLVQPRSACSRQSVPGNKQTLHPHTKKKDAFYKNNESHLKRNTPQKDVRMVGALGFPMPLNTLFSCLLNNLHTSLAFMSLRSK